MIDEDELLNIAITNIRKVLKFDPYKSYPDINNRDEFKQLIRSTDGLIPNDKFNHRIPKSWRNYDGIGFEVRSCYQIGDSKRIQADCDMSLALKSYKILPVMLVFCSTSLKNPLARLSKSWEVYEGIDSFNLVTSISVACLILSNSSSN
ncbi:MAG: hypothetical protein QNJ33_01125 [Crocosphaera sp.]|nr:hypothetical protein [Crocosphaera sp.]